MWWRVGKELIVDLVCVRHPLAEVAVHDCWYDGLDCLACLLHVGSCGCCEGVEIGADVLHFVSVARAQGMFLAILRVIAEVASGRN